MQEVTLNNGVNMPLVGGGTFPFTGKELNSVLGYYWDAGYRLFDTAWLYNNEQVIGDFLREKGDGECFITSKLHSKQLFLYYNTRFNIGIKKSSVRKAYLGSCKRL